MAYHKSNLGKFAPEGHADLDGYIPQEGDKPEDFRYEHGVQESFTEDFDAYGNGYEGYAAEEWEEHVAGAVAATEEAERKLREWQQAHA